MGAGVLPLRDGRMVFRRSSRFTRTVRWPSRDTGKRPELIQRHTLTRLTPSIAATSAML